MSFKYRVVFRNLIKITRLSPPVSRKHPSNGTVLMRLLELLTWWIAYVWQMPNTRKHKTEGCTDLMVEIVMPMVFTSLKLWMQILGIDMIFLQKRRCNCTHYTHANDNSELFCFFSVKLMKKNSKYIPHTYICCN